ncbi:MAG: hypothetical protein QHC90_13995 [Shinella sp.]|nr:hypothetical protein [Shinella sp.]
MADRMIDTGKPATHGADTAEFINRLAEKMRRESGTDLPHQYFLEKVRRQLAGKAPISDQMRNGTGHHLQSADCFNTWAMPDGEARSAAGKR